MFVLRICTEITPGELASMLSEQLQELPLLGRLVVPLVRHAHLRVLIGAGRAAHPDVHLMLRDEADGDLLPASPGRCREFDDGR